MIDAYLKIEGINGESEDEKHKQWIEVNNVVYVVHQPRAETLSTAGGHTSGRAELYPITFKKLADIASPVLLQTAQRARPSPRRCLSSCGLTATASQSRTSRSS